MFKIRINSNDVQKAQYYMIYIVYCSKSVHKHGFNKEPIDAVDT